jgi:hypothetical protein
MSGPLDVLEGGTGPSWWRAGWTALPPAGRRALVAVVVLLLIGGGVVALRSWSAERETRRAVELTAALDVTSSSTSPPGGSVRYFVRIGNDGPRPVSVTSIAAGGGGLRVRMQEDADRRVDPGRELEIPVSARLSCGGGLPAALPAVIGIRREDGGATTRRVELQPAATLLDVARTLCGVRPDLRDEELSGPVLRTG